MQKNLIPEKKAKTHLSPGPSVFHESSSSDGHFSCTNMPPPPGFIRIIPPTTNKKKKKTPTREDKIASYPPRLYGWRAQWIRDDFGPTPPTRGEEPYPVQKTKELVCARGGGQGCSGEQQLTTFNQQDCPARNYRRFRTRARSRSPVAGLALCSVPKVIFPKPRVPNYRSSAASLTLSLSRS